jgi:hypothetical protein
MFWILQCAFVIPTYEVDDSLPFPQSKVKKTQNVTLVRYFPRTFSPRLLYTSECNNS